MIGSIRKLFKKKDGISYLFPKIRSDISPDLRTGKYFIVQCLSWNYLRIDEGVEFREFCSILTMRKCSLNIGKNVFFNKYCSINCLDSISIGANTLFGEGVKMYDHNHKSEYHDRSLKIFRDEFTTAPIKIGSNCWIGSNVTILKGVEIGDNVIIGANCLIYKSIPSNTVVKLKQNLIISTNS